MSTEYDEIRRASCEWILAGARPALDMFGDVTTMRKADRSPVTEADHAVQDALQASIARHHPGDAVITEETQSRPEAHAPVTEATRCWVIDPIDGTRNYARSLPIFTVSIALFERGRPVVGFVYDPMTGRMYSASAGGGVWVDDRRVERSDQPASGTPFISIPTSRHEKLPAVVHAWIDRLVVRNLGSTALHLVMLAVGSLDAVYCRRSKLWDLAAGALLAAEAGAELVSLEGQSYFPMALAGYTDQQMPFLAARRPLLDELLADYAAFEAGSV